MDIFTLIIQLASGVLGSNLAVSLLQDNPIDKDPGLDKAPGISARLVTSAGMLGGLLGGQVMEEVLVVAPVAGALVMPNSGTVVTYMLAGGAGGGLLLVLIGISKLMLHRQARSD